MRGRVDAIDAGKRAGGRAVGECVGRVDTESEGRAARHWVGEVMALDNRSERKTGSEARHTRAVCGVRSMRLAALAFLAQNQRVEPKDRIPILLELILLPTFSANVAAQGPTLGIFEREVRFDALSDVCMGTGM